MKSPAVGCSSLPPEHRSRAEIRDALQHHLDATSSNFTDDDPDRSFFVADLGEIYRCYAKWKFWLPRVKPFYAVKCNSNDTTVKFLHRLGLGFDCASQAELQHILSMGTSPDRIIYAHPCKSPSFIHFSRSAGVSKMTFDNTDELYKLQANYPGAELVLRIAAHDHMSSAPMSDKFGAQLASVMELLELARSLSLQVIGVSFHIGSGARDPRAFQRAVADARWAFDQARKFGFAMRVLDVGGGFTIDNFEFMATTLHQALETYFPPEKNLEIIAEPGRFFVSSAYTLACKVIARKVISPHKIQLYINDGVYSNFLCAVTDHDIFKPKVLCTKGQVLYGAGCRDVQTELTEDQVVHSVWGQTCDGVDCISRHVKFNMRIDVGDWLYFERMGAYTLCSRTRFNGFTDSQDIIFVSSEPEATRIFKK